MTTGNHLRSGLFEVEYEPMDLEYGANQYICACDVQTDLQDDGGSESFVDKTVADVLQQLKVGASSSYVKSKRSRTTYSPCGL
jgi:hypothetical protein